MTSQPPNPSPDALSAAWNAAYMWADAVVRLADRTLDSADATTVEHLGDAALLAVALRNVLRAGEMARNLADHEDATKITQAIQAFRRLLPDAKNARDVLEHFDEYAIGKGRLQKADQKAGRSFTYYRVWYERGAGSYVLRVGPLRIDVEAAKRAGADVAAAVGLAKSPSQEPSPGAVWSTHARYLGPGQRDEEHIIQGGRYVTSGEVVPFPGIYEGQVDKTPPGGRYVVERFEAYADNLVYAVARWEASDPS